MIYGWGILVTFAAAVVVLVPNLPISFDTFPAYFPILGLFVDIDSVCRVIIEYDPLIYLV
jgi:hypothetical protein